MLPQGRGRIEFEPSMSLIFSGDVPNAAPLELDPEPVIPRLTRNEKTFRLYMIFYPGVSSSRSKQLITYNHTNTILAQFSCA